MANLSNINNKFLVTTGGNVLIGQTSAVGSSIFQVTGSVNITGGTTSGLNITTSGTQDTININRAASNDNAITKYQTASADKWIVGLRNTSDDNFRFYSYGTSTDVLTINQGNGSATFAGNVGIGAAASDGNLHVRKTGINTGITNVLMNANFADGSNGTGLSIGYRTDETTAVLAARTATGNIAFYSYDGGWSESMRIANTGIVKINTTAVNARFRVDEGRASEWVAGFKHTGTTPYGVFIDTSVNTSTGYTLGCYTNTGTGLFVKNDGKVGIGEIAPAHKLSIKATDDTRGILVNNTLTTSYAEVALKASREFRMGTGGSASDTSARDRWYVYDKTATAHRLTLDSSGNFGIGTTSPGTKLQVNQTNNDIYQLTLHNTHLSTTTKTRIGNWANDSKFSSNYMQSGGTKTQDDATISSWVQSMGGSLDIFDISRSPAGSTTLSSLMTIDSSGNVGIGVTPSATYTGYRALDIGLSGQLFSNASGGDSVALVFNAYLNTGASAWVRKQASAASFLNQSDNGFQFYTAPSDSAGTNATFTERMRIDSSGNVKLAITNATSSTTIGKDAGGMWMETSGSTNALSDMRFQARASGAGSYSAIRIKPSNQSLEFQTSNAVRMLVNSVGNVQILGIGNKNKGNLQLGPETTGSKWSILTGSHYNATSGSGNGSGSAGVMMIGVNAENGENHLVIGGAIYEANAATAIQFWTHTTDTSTAGGTERMRITSVGNVDIANPTTGNAGTRIWGGSDGGIIYMYRPINQGTQVMRFYVGTTSVGYIGTSNTGAAFTSNSDYRLKENVVELTGALDRISELKPSRFNFIVEPNKTVDGFLAHEVQDIVPEAVFGEKDAVDEEGNPDYQAMEQSKLVPLLVAAIQELKAEIELLKSK